MKIGETGDYEGAYDHEFFAGRGNLPADVNHHEVLQQNQFFLIDDATGKAVGTGTAWRTIWHAQYYRDMSLLQRASDDVEILKNNICFSTLLWSINKL